MIKISQRLIPVIVTALILFSTTSIYLGVEIENAQEPVRQSVLLENGVLRIKNDTHLMELAEKQEWEGNGSKEEPYIIQGYDIDARGKGSAVHVGNTTLHLHIKDSTFHNASWRVGNWHTGAAVTLYRATNITLQNNNCSDSRYGVILDRAYDNRILGNVLENNRFRGLDLQGGGGNKIYDNSFFGKGGLLIDDSSSNIFYGNEFSERGFSFEGSRDTYVGQTIGKNNTVHGKQICYYNNMYGDGLAIPSNTGQVIFGNVTYLMIEGLDITNSNVIIGYSFNVTISENSIARNPGYTGIIIVSSENITVARNTLSNNEIGISLYKTINSLITDNNLQNNIQEGILLEEGSNNEVINNKLDRCGIRIESSNSNSVNNNLIFKNSGFGIGIESGSDNVIHANVLLYNNRATDTYNSSRIQAYDDSLGNNWNSTNGKGNYWRDWTEPDEDNDGIVDESYGILGNESYDNHPLTEPPMPILPDKPGNLSMVIGNSELTINWKAPLEDGGSAIQGYRIYRRNISDDSEYTFVIENGQTTAFKDEGVTNGLVYSYRVSAFNSIGESLITSSIQGEPDGIPPILTIHSPANNTYITEQEVEIIWNHSDENSGVSHSEIRLNDGNWTETEKNTSYTFFDLTEDEHRIYIRVYDNAGNHISKWIRIIVDFTPPSIISHSPIGNDIPIYFEIIVEFSEPMNTDSVNISIPGLPLRRIRWVNDTIAITEPVENATYGRTYHVFVIGEDIVGHSLGTHRWQFNTTKKGTITGRVVDRDGEPIWDVNVSITNGNFVLTDIDGRFTITASQGTQTLYLQKRGYEDRKITVQLKAGEVNELDTITLQLLSSHSDLILIIVSMSIVISGILAFALFMLRIEKKEFGEIDDDIIDEDTEELPPEFLE